jgi:hypothetical protein
MQRPALDGGSDWWRTCPPSLEYEGMRQSSDAAAGGAGHGEPEGNRWINSGSRIDLRGMKQSRRAAQGAFGGVPMTSAGRGKPTDGALALDIGPVMAQPQTPIRQRPPAGPCIAQGPLERSAGGVGRARLT